MPAPPMTHSIGATSQRVDTGLGWDSSAYKHTQMPGIFGAVVEAAANVSLAGVCA